MSVQFSVLVCLSNMYIGIGTSHIIQGHPKLGPYDVVQCQLSKKIVIIETIRVTFTKVNIIPMQYSPWRQ